MDENIMRRTVAAVAFRIIVGSGFSSFSSRAADYKISSGQLGALDMLDLSNNSNISVFQLDDGYWIKHLGTGECAYLRVNVESYKFDGRYLTCGLGYCGAIDGLRLRLWNENSSIAHEYVFAPDYQTQ
jgi:hypothetical protein